MPTAYSRPSSNTRSYIRRHDLAPQYEYLRSEINEALGRVLGSGRYILANEVHDFEREFAGYIGCDYALGVGSGTDALVLALRAAGIQPGDEVITSTYAPTPTPAAILMAGGIPVFSDVEADTCLMDTRNLEELMTEKTRFIIPVHIFGLPCNMREIAEMARKYDLLVVEDAAQAHGSRIGDKKAGSFGSLSCFSFYPTKNLGGYGDGGMVLTNDPGYHETLLRLRNYGKQDDPFTSYVQGVNSRLDELQASVLRVKLEHLDRMNRERARRAEMYRKGLKDTPLVFLNTRPGYLESVYTNHHILTVLCPDLRDALRAHLELQGIQTNIYYPTLLHQMPAYSPFVKKSQGFETAENLSRQALALPLYPELDVEDVEYVIEKILDFFA
ncbi:MAG: DegT/DnrJ/EryC1/StrS family aminotransferase [Desulfohalobiaceae bacterium]|nr:DegT/DnrJ/EryC1/StrS family aminotransferase [Desulfohalobiaceae bacterium]